MTTPFIDLSSDLVRNLRRYAGPGGQRWLDELPRRVQALAGRWQLADVEPFTNLSFNFLADATQAGRRVVLKIGWEDQAIRREGNWLSHYGQHTEDLVVPITGASPSWHLLRGSMQVVFLPGGMRKTFCRVFGHLTPIRTQTSPVRLRWSMHLNNHKSAIGLPPVVRLRGLAHHDP